MRSFLSQRIPKEPTVLYFSQQMISRYQVVYADYFTLTSFFLFSAQHFITLFYYTIFTKKAQLSLDFFDRLNWCDTMSHQYFMFYYFRKEPYLINSLKIEASGSVTSCHIYSHHHIVMFDLPHFTKNLFKYTIIWFNIICR